MIDKDERIMLKHIDDVPALLKIWADWQDTGTGQNIGYPKSSAFIHADEGRETCVASDSNKIAEEIERAMGILKSTWPKLFECLLCEYVHKLTIQQAANRIGRGEKTYREWRKEGERFIGGVIAGKFA